MYKFIQIHSAGEWNPNDVEETSIFQELQGSVERAVVTVIGLDPNDLGNKTISIQVEGETNPRILITNSQGQAETLIKKGLTYNIYPQTFGDYTVQNYLNVKAALNERYINISYQSGQIETCTLEVNIVASGGGSINDFIGSILSIFSDDNQAISATIDNTGKATFSNINKYTTYTINSIGLTSNNSTTYRKPANSTISTSLSVNSVNLEYTRTDIGLFLVNGTTWEETELTQEFIDTLDSTMKSTYIAIHVCTEALLNVGCDYYVRCRDLTSERLATESTTKQWSISMVDYPHISSNTSDYNGKKNTYYMIYDSVNLGIQSPAAIFATSQTLEINEEILTGYIGTVDQMSLIYSNIGNRGLVVSALNKIGYSTVNYISTDTLSSSEYSSQPNFYCYYWAWAKSGFFAGIKTSNFLTIPFFTHP